MLELEYAKGVELTAYANDIGVLIMAGQDMEPNRKANRTLGIINWMEENSLKLAEEKTELVIVKDQEKGTWWK